MFRQLSLLRTPFSAVRTNVDWAAMTSSANGTSKGGAEAKAAVNRFRAALGEIDALHEKYAGSAPPPIDFDSFRSRIKQKGLVDQMEKAYKAKMASMPSKMEWHPKALEEGAAIDAEGDKQEAEMLVKQEEAFAKAAKEVSESAARIEELEAEVAMMIAKKTDRTTTTDDVFEAYPDLKKEVEEEIENHEWQKDIA